MNPAQWIDQPHFAALDWAREHHDLVVIDRLGQIKETLRFEHNAAGWQEAKTRLTRYPQLPVAVETSHGTVVEQLFALGVTVYPVNPKCAQRYRERHAPTGVKDDARDAWSMADALRLDGHAWRALAPLDPLILELRLLCRDEITLIAQRTALINQLRQALHEYYPTALEAFDEWTLPAAWAFIEAFPTPAALRQAGRRRWEKFFLLQKLWRRDIVARRMAIFERATAFGGTAAMAAAKSLLAVSLARLLRVVDRQLREYRERIAAVFNQHPDHALAASLPGAGEKLAPRLLAEVGDDRQRFPDAAALQGYAGTAPVTVQSGQMHYQKIRFACNTTLRSTVHLWADLSRSRCLWADTYYRAHRAKGQSHACAIRCLGQRWIKIFWKMWQAHACYDESVHHANQRKHGSWLSTQLPTAAN